MLKLKFLAVAGLALLWSGCGHKVYKPSNDIQINQEQLKNLQAQNPKADVFDFRRLTPSDPTGGGGEPQGIIIVVDVYDSEGHHLGRWYCDTEKPGPCQPAPLV